MGVWVGSGVGLDGWDKCVAAAGKPDVICRSDFGPDTTGYAISAVYH